MNNLLAALEETLAEEIRLEKDLLAAGARKRDALVALDMKGVEQATLREQTLILSVASAAERRLRRTSEAARRMGIAEREAGVTRIARLAGEPWCLRLLEKVEELRRILKDVGRVNGSNKALAEQSLDHVKQFFRVLGGAEQEVTYSRRGLEARPEIPKIIIDHVA